MDKSTGKELLLNDKVVESELKFTAKSQNEKINVPIKVDTSLLKGKTIVAFEELSYKGKLFQNIRVLMTKIKQF